MICKIGIVSFRRKLLGNEAPNMYLPFIHQKKCSFSEHFFWWF